MSGFYNHKHLHTHGMTAHRHQHAHSGGRHPRMHLDAVKEERLRQQPVRHLS